MGCAVWDCRYGVGGMWDLISAMQIQAGPRELREELESCAKSHSQRFFHERGQERSDRGKLIYARLRLECERDFDCTGL